jgi:hypothetical protein
MLDEEEVSINHPGKFIVKLRSKLGLSTYWGHS